jgi:hypothetical protein
MTTIKLDKVSGKKVISTGDLVYCNTKYHAPYLAVIDDNGNPIWQEKVYIGYGKHRETYYSVEGLQAGDIIKAAGGSGGNKYPYVGRVVSVSDTHLEVEPISEKEMSNILAERSAA